MKSSHLVGVAAAAAAAAAIGGGLFLAPGSASKPDAPKPVPLRYWPTAKIEAELAPKIGQVLIDGIPCRVYGSQRFRRAVLVCSA